MVKSALLRYLAPLLAGALAAAPALGTEIYRWVGEDGAVSFSDRPPQSRPAERVEVEPPMGALPLQDAEEILRRPVRPPPEPETEIPSAEREPAAEDTGEVDPEFLRDRRGRR